ncbi:MAG: hypothetical protein IJR56_06880, partial [Bacteroidaceae bacterium]|nr:hypothetical protein [Bacteroidaceae bacterium]
ASVNVQRRQKTYEAFSLLPDEFTTKDVVRCFGLNSENTARIRIIRLTNDHLVEKVGDYTENGVSRSLYRKTGTLML